MDDKAGKNKELHKICKLHIILKQLTPMIHFQYKQEGATLRATELKPKLDRFILEMVEKSDSLVGKYDKKIITTLQDIKKNSKKYFLTSQNGERALRYKVRIFAKGKNKFSAVKKKTKIGAYFFVGDDGKNYTLYDEVEVDILCFEDELCAVLEKFIPIFMAVTNFGFRQDKGFGHFAVSKVNSFEYGISRQGELIKEYIQLQNENSLLYSLKLKQSDNYEGILNVISNFNQRLKSGLSGEVNDKEYIKSFLLKEYRTNFKYMNEKKYIKQTIMKKNTDLYFRKHTSKDYLENDKLFKKLNSKVKYYRGILGFAKQYTFTRVSIGGENDMECKIIVGVNYYCGRKKMDNIRFSSPMYFLPVINVKNDYETAYIYIHKSKFAQLKEQDISVKFSINKISSYFINGDMVKKYNDLTPEEKTESGKKIKSYGKRQEL